MILAGTGHRPDQLIYGYANEGVEYLAFIADIKLKELKPDQVITGLAIGWDLALAVAAIRLKIPLIGAMPFKGQESRWPEASQRLYNRVISRCERVEIICEGGFENWKFLRRDEWMVDNADKVLALYNGCATGGTKHTVDYACKVGKPVINCWDLYNENLPPWKES